MDCKLISVIVPAHNEEKYISQCLESLAAQDYPKQKYEVIVVDNNSTDQTSEIANNFEVKIVQKTSGPVGAVRNAGAKLANGELLAFIDADCVAPADWLSKGANLLNTHGTVYGGDCDLRKHPHWIEKAWLLENELPPKDLLGCCIFIRKIDFLKIGLFDEKITSGEDTKLSNSLKSQHYNVVMTKEINVIHLGNPTTLKSFFLRQVWHSENYFQNWNETRTDPTFYLVVLFLFGLIFCISSLINQTISNLLVSISFVFGIPFVFTVKRLRRSKVIRNDLRNLPAIYFLDLVYLSGRIIGLAKSIWKEAMRFTSLQSQRVD
ncbi:glycosyltransferase [Marinobacter sp. 1-3A]|uniref:glycosyltransferase n=1 Tax=Marinobacter sp. 1-3A TaxID=2582920 RepID=UPI001905E3E6|nr:glycosyltransferase [Marinobacter sp. 1-3A]MBK1871741.1 glycosyltransferase [Marinobacter sp. 1-3A]